MAKGGEGTLAPNREPGFFDRIQQFITDVRSEMRKVNWPPKDEVKSMTQVVMVALLIMAAIVMVYDRVFLFAVQLLLRLG